MASYSKYLKNDSPLFFIFSNYTIDIEMLLMKCIELHITKSNRNELVL